MSEMIHYDDPTAATQKTIDVWVSKDGQAFYTEDAARYHSCTHRPCSDCSAPAEKMYTRCRDCREKMAVEKYAAREFQTWKGQPLYSEVTEAYYFHEDSVRDAADELGIAVTDMRLLICEELIAGEIDPNEFYVDELPDEMTFEDVASDKLIKAFDELNAAIREAGQILSWVPGERRTCIQEPSNG